MADNIARFAAGSATSSFPVCILLKDWEYNEDILEEMDYVHSGWKNEIHSFQFIFRERPLQGPSSLPVSPLSGQTSKWCEHDRFFSYVCDFVSIANIY